MKNSIFNAVCKTRYLALLVVLILTCGNVWGADGDKAYTLDFTAKTANHASYVDTWTYGDFSIYAGSNNNYNNGWLWVRFGGKGGSAASSVSTINSTITSTRAITDKVIKKVTVYYTQVTNDNYTANKCTLEVASNSTFTSIVDTRIIDSPVKSAGTTFDFTPNTVTVWPASAYYRITIGATIKGSKNIGVDVSKVEFIEGASGGGSTCATPTFSVAAGTYTSSQSVTLSCTTTGATIHYTTDGTTPTSSSPTYSSAITVDVTKTIKAIAVKSGMTNSEVASATYTIKCATPTFSPGAGTYTSVKSVSISTTYGTSIYYTTDGTTPSTSSTLYSSAISVSESQTIKAIAVKTGCSNSEVGEAAYIINLPYTVSFSTGTGNPTVSSRTEANAGAGITLPAGPTPACSSDGWVFFGWKETSAQSSSTTAPDVLAAGMTYKPASNCTLYAVYYKQADSNPNYYTKVTSSDNLTSGQYVIYANDEAMNNVITSSKIAGKSVSETSSGIISTTDADIIWTLYKNGTNYQLYNAGVGKYLYTDTSNKLELKDNSGGFTLDAFTTSTGQVSLQSVDNTGLKFQYYDGNFSSFKSQSVAVFFYKRGGTYNSNPTCCENKVTLSAGSPSNGTVVFSPTGPIATCSATNSDRQTTVTVTPNAGYKLTGWTKAVSGIALPDSTSAISTSSGNTAAQSNTYTFAQNANGSMTVTATFTAMIDHFIDKLHNKTGYTESDNHAESGVYTVPNPGDASTPSPGDDSCEDVHYKFVGWAPSSDVNPSTGAVTSTANMIYGGTTGHAASDVTYWAVWAKEE